MNTLHLIYYMRKIVILSGAGMSAESGLKTFRDSDGLWENHNIYDVATPEAWARDPELVLNFYNDRRKQVQSTKPNVCLLYTSPSPRDRG